MVLFKKRDKLLKFLIKNKIEAKIHYPIPLNKQKAFKNSNQKIRNFKRTNYQSNHLITLPVHVPMISNFSPELIIGLSIFSI